MALRKTGKLADSIAKPNGIYSKDGELLIANNNTFYINSKEFMDTWNGTKQVVEEAPVYKVEPEVEKKKTKMKDIHGTPKVTVAEKKKMWPKKK